MSNVRTQAPQTISVDVDNPIILNFRRSIPNTHVINLTDDDTESNAPSSVRRRIAEPIPEDDVVILDASHDANRGRWVSNGAANRPIVVPDSDEEYSSNAGPSRPRASFRIFSPPPPPPEYHPIPPVPRIPPPIVARSNSFAILPRSEENTSVRDSLPFDEPPQPSTSSSLPRGSRIQLGGGLLSQGTRPRRSQPSRSNDVDDLARAGRVVATFTNEQRRGNNPFRNALEAGARLLNAWNVLSFPSEEEADLLLRRRRPTRFLNFSADVLRHRNEIIGLGPDYTKDMTHSGKPPPGWSFDFGTEDVETVDVDAPGKNTTAPTDYLVCAMCLDPLYANVEERSDLTDEEKKRKRIWALRCGHMFDGKCIEGFMVPDYQKVFTTTEREKAAEKGKGKEVEKVEAKDNALDLELLSGEPQTVNRDSPAQNNSPSTSQNEVVEILDSGTTGADLSHTTPAPTTPFVNRYNLRTRRPPQEANPSPTRSNRRGRSGVGRTEEPDPPTRQARGTKRKRDQKIAKTEPPINAIQYQWNCPVAGCGRAHNSYKLREVWKPDEENGPIAVYI